MNENSIKISSARKKLLDLLEGRTTTHAVDLRNRVLALDAYDPRILEIHQAEMPNLALQAQQDQQARRQRQEQARFLANPTWGVKKEQ